MYGFYKNKRIVLFDTLIEGYKTASEKKEEEEKAQKAKESGQDEAISTEKNDKKVTKIYFKRI